MRVWAVELGKVSWRENGSESQLVDYTGVFEQQQRGVARGEGLEKRTEGAKAICDGRLATG